jgi:hypothetical protein
MIVELLGERTQVPLLLKESLVLEGNITVDDAGGGGG